MRIAPVRADAATLLARALRISAAPYGIAIDAVSIDDRPWASATFEGVRHHVTLSLSGADPQRWLAALSEAELPMRHHIVADLAVEATTGPADRMQVTLTALTLAER